MSMPVEVRALIEKFNRLGALLPRPGDETDAALEDAHARANVRLVLQEMARVRSRILAAARAASAN